MIEGQQLTEREYQRIWQEVRSRRTEPNRHKMCIAFGIGEAAIEAATHFVAQIPATARQLTTKNAPNGILSDSVGLTLAIAIAHEETAGGVLQWLEEPSEMFCYGARPIEWVAAGRTKDLIDSVLFYRVVQMRAPAHLRHLARLHCCGRIAALPDEARNTAPRITAYA